MVDNRYRVNAGSVFSLKYHLVWCPKYRKRILTNALEKRLRELLYRKAKEIKATIHALEIMPDHVHMFVESDPTTAPARLAAGVQGIHVSPTQGGVSLAQVVSPVFVV
jgi:putative transposase